MVTTAWERVDIRLAVGEPHGDAPIMLICPFHEDDTGSLAVYSSNIHCFGNCGFHLKRRYSSLAFLLGLWDGRGSEDGTRVRDAVKKIDLSQFVSGKLRPSAKFVPPPPDPITVEAFHQYFLRYGPLESFMKERGLSIETIRGFKLGSTGTHFTLPVHTVEGSLTAIRYRADETVVDKYGEGFKKYDGTWGRNQPYLYPLRAIQGVKGVEELFIVEGEFDALAAIQAGMTTLTVTGGAGAVAKILDMLADELPWLHINRFVVCVDQDQAGEECARKILGCLGCNGVRARWSLGKDLGEFFARGGRREQIRVG